MSDLFNQDLTWLIIALGVLTFLTRILGDLVLSRFETIHPRLEAGLNAIPAAVITTLVVPPALTKGPLEAMTLVIVAIACLKIPSIIALGIGLLFLVFARIYIPI